MRVLAVAAIGGLAAALGGCAWLVDFPAYDGEPAAAPPAAAPLYDLKLKVDSASVRLLPDQGLDAGPSAASLRVSIQWGTADRAPLTVSLVREGNAPGALDDVLAATFPASVEGTANDLALRLRVRPGTATGQRIPLRLTVTTPNRVAASVALEVVVAGRAGTVDPSFGGGRGAAHFFDTTPVQLAITETGIAVLSERNGYDGFDPVRKQANLAFITRDGVSELYTGLAAQIGFGIATAGFEPHRFCAISPTLIGGLRAWFYGCSAIKNGEGVPFGWVDRATGQNSVGGVPSFFLKAQLVTAALLVLPPASDPLVFTASAGSLPTLADGGFDLRPSPPADAPTTGAFSLARGSQVNADAIVQIFGVPGSCAVRVRAYLPPLPGEAPAVTLVTSVEAFQPDRSCAPLADEATEIVSFDRDLLERPGVHVNVVTRAAGRDPEGGFILVGLDADRNLRVVRLRGDGTLDPAFGPLGLLPRLPDGRPIRIVDRFGVSLAVDASPGHPPYVYIAATEGDAADKPVAGRVLRLLRGGIVDKSFGDGGFAVGLPGNRVGPLLALSTGELLVTACENDFKVDDACTAIVAGTDVRRASFDLLRIWP